MLNRKEHPIDRGLRLEAARRVMSKTCAGRAEQWRAEALTYADEKRRKVCELLALGEERQALLLDLLDALDRADVQNECDLVEGGATIRDAAAYRAIYEQAGRRYLVTRLADQAMTEVDAYTVWSHFGKTQYATGDHPEYLAKAVEIAKGRA